MNESTDLIYPATLLGHELPSVANVSHTAPSDAAQPLRVLFMLTSMPVGGAETLLVNLVRGVNRNLIEPELCCLKQPGPLGEELVNELPVHSEMIHHRRDVRVIGRLSKLMRERKIDAVVTVGAGDKMFWGRIAAWWAGVPVVTSALHSTGWPDGIGWLNHRLTAITDGFIAVAKHHGEHLVKQEHLPQRKVFVIPNGIDTTRFCPASNIEMTRTCLNFDSDRRIVSIVAALRPEKNHSRFLRVAAAVKDRLDDVDFLIVGDGPERRRLEAEAAELQIAERVHFVGSRPDIPELLACSNLFVLTSDNEASPVSILEAMACGLPVVASDVGSIGQMVETGVTGYCVLKTDEQAFAERIVSILGDEKTASRMGTSARQRVVERGSLDVMIRGYERLLWSIYRQKERQGALKIRDTIAAHHGAEASP